MPRRDDYDYEDDRHDDREANYDDYYSDDDDYDDRPKHSRGRSRAAERVTLPAIFLMVVGGLGFLMAGLALVGALMGPQPNPFVNQQQQNQPGFQEGQRIGRIIAPIPRALWSIIVLAGGFQLKNLRNRGFVMFSCIFAMLPCNECCVLGIFFGIWGIVVIGDENVKRAFA